MRIYPTFAQCVAARLRRGGLFAGGLLASGSAAVWLAIVPFVTIGGSAALALTWLKQSSE